MSEIHSCSYYCTRPACVLAQRDELRGRFLQRGQRVDKWLTNAEPQVNKEQAEPVAIPGAIPMSQVAARSRSMPERAAALEAAREQAKPVPPWYRQFCNCLKCSEALPQAEPVADSGNPSY